MFVLEDNLIFSRAVFPTMHAIHFLYLIIVSFTVCCSVTGCKESHDSSQHYDAEVLAKTDLLLGNVRILSDMHRVAMISPYGKTGIWDTKSGRFEWRKSGLENPWLLDVVPEEDKCIVKSDVSNSQNRHQEGCIDRMQVSILGAETMETIQSFQMPLGPHVGCWCAENTYAIETWNQEENQKDEGRCSFGIWHAEDGRLTDTLRFPEKGCSVATACRLDSSHIVLHLKVGTSSSEAASDNSTSEIVVWNFENGKICNRASTEITTNGIGRLSITQGEKLRAILTSSTHIEVRELPSLRVVKRREIPKDSSLELAIVSGDRRYVAFGFSRVEVWDLETDKISLLGSLSEDTINSPDFCPLSPSGELLDRNMYVLDYVRAATQRTVADLRFSKDGKR
ncbi:MAG: hypothetical protein U9N87_05495, partial [Planctomycetota bacterium]|nr:hypothetical protein [Planctomycetota bacterium]